MKTVLSIVLSFMSLLWFNPVLAQEAILKPFVLASKSNGALAGITEATKTALTSNGFNLVGSYSPNADATILIVTNSETLKNAGESDFGAYGAAQRVAITKVKDEVQVSYTNPIYMANAYRMKGDLQGVAQTLEKALGKLEEYGSSGLTAKKVRDYHYMVSMPYFDDPVELAEYDSYEQAIASVEAGLAEKGTTVSKVYRVDVPGKQESVFGVAIAGKSPTADESDQFIMSVIDFGPIKSTAHLPYEIVISGNKAYSLNAKFRIAINFSDLKMAGANSFMKIMAAPGAITKALESTIIVKK
jgi:hypothetical protein